MMSLFSQKYNIKECSFICAMANPAVAQYTLPQYDRWRKIERMNVAHYHRNKRKYTFRLVFEKE